MAAKTDHILQVMETMNEVKDDLREVRSTVERHDQNLIAIGFAVGDLSEDVREINEGPMYSVEQYLKRQVIRIGGGLGALIAIILMITGWKL